MVTGMKALLYVNRVKMKPQRYFKKTGIIVWNAGKNEHTLFNKYDFLALLWLLGYVRLEIPSRKVCHIQHITTGVKMSIVHMFLLKLYVTSIYKLNT